MKRALVFVLVLVIILPMLLASCGGNVTTPTSTQQSTTTAKKVQFGLVTFMSGPAAPWGIGMSRLMQLWIDQNTAAGGFTVQGQRYNWDLVITDDQYDPAKAVTQLSYLVSQKNTKFVCVVAASCAAAAAPIINQEGLLNISGATADPTIFGPSNPNSFVMALMPPEQTYTVWFKWFAANKSVKSVASINPNDEAGSQCRDGAIAAAKATGVQMVDTELYNAGGATTDFIPILTKVLQTKPDMIDLGTSAPSDAALIVKQARQLGFNGPMLLWEAQGKQVSDITGGAYAQNTYSQGTSSEDAQLAPFAQDIRMQFIANYGEEPLALWLYVDMMVALTQAIEDANSLAVPDVIKALEKVSVTACDGSTWTCSGASIFGGLKRHLGATAVLSQYKDGIYSYLMTASAPAGY